LTQNQAPKQRAGSSPAFGTKNTIKRSRSKMISFLNGFFYAGRGSPVVEKLFYLNKKPYHTAVDEAKSQKPKAPFYFFYFSVVFECFHTKKRP
jgi:hypothetical protein